MEHTWSQDYDGFCVTCQTWLPIGECPGEPRRTQTQPRVPDDPQGEAAAQTAYERRFGWTQD